MHLTPIKTYTCSQLVSMNPTTMEHKIDNDHNDDEGDALSLRDLQMYDQTSTRSSPRTSSGQELFEFFPTLSHPPDPIDEDNNHHHLRAIGSSSSLRLPERAVERLIPLRSVSSRVQGSPRHGAKLSTSVKKENMTASASMSSKSKRRMFTFGLVKFMPEMEMRSIRERQSRRAPARMFPPVDGGDGRKEVAGGNKRCRARLNSVFERSIACLGV